MTQKNELTIDEILLIPTGDWTPEQTERVKKAIASGEVTIDRSPWSFPATPVTPLRDIPFWDLLNKTICAPAPADDCAIARYFKDNPDKTSVHMVCTCRRCTPYC
jgi:IS5 family transposase